jgi:type 1 fimbria pilin
VKKSILAMAVSAMFMVSAAQAETNPNDVSAVLTVSGTVTESQNCAVQLSQSSVALDADVTTLQAQGATNSQVSGVSLSIDGCSALVTKGQLAFKFIGTADDALGTSLANSSTGEGAASGIGIALYDVIGNVVNINSDTMTVNANNVNKLGLGLVKLDGQEATAGSVQGSLTIQVERL